MQPEPAAYVVGSGSSLPVRVKGLAGESLVSVIETTGNTSSASMGLALDHPRRGGKLRQGQKILLPAFTAGFAWGAGLLTVE